ncbi:hypothetical protein KEM54_000751 [Ascosphaera aggregata]|nr:hypothetical protein KEM54_000751 [Ascosphaera aggregata]
MAADKKVFSATEVAKHSSRESCFVVIHDKVYDVTNFLPEHPGGAKIILKYAGKDATEAFDPVHPAGTLEENLSPDACLGIIDAPIAPRDAQEEKADMMKEKKADNTAAHDPGVSHVPKNISQCLNMDDIERLAISKLSKRAFAYYYSASDDLHTKYHNNRAYRSILLRPRVFKDVSPRSLDLTTTTIGQTLGIPIFVCPAAMARLGHPTGEAGIAAGCASFGAMQIISNNASMTPEEIVKNSKPGQCFGWQLYVQNDRKRSEAMLQRINKLVDAGGIKFVCLTLDAAAPGKREMDVKSQFDDNDSDTTDDRYSEGPQVDKKAGGIGEQLFAGTAADLTWMKTMTWLNQLTSLPIVLKGLQTHEDAYIASCLCEKFNIKGLILSNHGGRAVDTAPPPIYTLLEIRKYCPEVLKKLDIWVDGGIKRGTDVVKALALGAKAVGVGRNALYGLAAAGPRGVERMLRILSDETGTAMRLLGVNRISELGPEHVNTRAVESLIYDATAVLDIAADLLGVTEKAKL